MDRAGRIILVTVALLWVAQPVQARNDKASCRKGFGCVWDETDFQGSRTQVPSTGCIDSNIQSAVNGSDQALVFFVGGGCAGPQAGTLQPGEEWSRINARSATGDCSRDPIDPCGDG